jgi:hypothetical protein
VCACVPSSLAGHTYSSAVLYCTDPYTTGAIGSAGGSYLLEQVPSSIPNQVRNPAVLFCPNSVFCLAMS